MSMGLYEEARLLSWRPEPNVDSLAGFGDTNFRNRVVGLFGAGGFFGQRRNRLNIVVSRCQGHPPAWLSVWSFVK